VTAPLEPGRAAHVSRAATVASSAIRGDVLRGLLASPKTLPPKLFYDARGAELFERICGLDEYYLTRAELSILRKEAATIAALAGPGCALVEYGSGAGIKVSLLLDALDRPRAYVPIDVSRDQLARVASDLAARYPGVDVTPVCADYTEAFELPHVAPGARRIAFFPGSTIGNLHPAEATAFLYGVRRAIGPGGAMILGLDRRKDAAALHAAYNDALGVTAEFNLNVLARINRELGGEFDLERFRHRALFNDRASRIEMHLESTEAQIVCVAGVPVTFEAGETIWTESSYKYDDALLRRVVGAAGFVVRDRWTDSAGQFWVAWLESDA